MKLIEDDLQDVLAKAPAGDEVFVSRALLERVLKELAHMRDACGVVTAGESFDDIAARVGRHPKEERT